MSFSNKICYLNGYEYSVGAIVVACYHKVGAGIRYLRFLYGESGVVVGDFFANTIWFCYIFCALQECHCEVQIKYIESVIQFRYKSTITYILAWDRQQF